MSSELEASSWKVSDSGGGDGEGREGGEGLGVGEGMGVGKGEVLEVVRRRFGLEFLLSGEANLRFLAYSLFFLDIFNNCGGSISIFINVISRGCEGETALRNYMRSEVYEALGALFDKIGDGVLFESLEHWGGHLRGSDFRESGRRECVLAGALEAPPVWAPGWIKVVGAIDEFKIVAQVCIQSKSLLRPSILTLSTAVSPPPSPPALHLETICKSPKMCTVGINK